MSARGTFFFTLSILATAGAGCAGLGESQRDLRTAVEARRDALSSCYGDALTRDPNAAGNVQARLLVSKSGAEVSDVAIDSSDLPDPEFQACFTSALREAQLSKAPAVNLDIAYTFQFTPS